MTRPPAPRVAVRPDVARTTPVPGVTAGPPAGPVALPEASLATPPHSRSPSFGSLDPNRYHQHHPDRSRRSACSPYRVLAADPGRRRDLRDGGRTRGVRGRRLGDRLWCSACSRRTLTSTGCATACPWGPCWRCCWSRAAIDPAQPGQARPQRARGHAVHLRAGAGRRGRRRAVVMAPPARSTTWPTANPLYKLTFNIGTHVGLAAGTAVWMAWPAARAALRPCRRS